MDPLITRRESLILGMGLACSACGGGGSGGGAGPAPAPPVTTPPPAPPVVVTSTPLKALAASRNMRFGSVFGGGTGGTLAGSFGDPAYREMMVRECSIAVHENELKWQALRPNPQTFSFARADEMLAFAEANGIAMRGTRYSGRCRSASRAGRSATTMEPTRAPRWAG